MTKVITKSITTNSADQTETWAAAIGANIVGGEFIELVSDLGGGKTTFVRGLLRGMGSSDHVASPTYTISKLYKAGQLDVYHFDFYRLPEAGLIAQELAEIIDDPQVVTVVEWAEVVKASLPLDRLTIKIDQLSSARQLKASYPAKLAYLFEAKK